MTKLKFKSDIFEFPNKFFFIYIYIFIIFLKYVKISKVLSAKYYQENKERLQKSL